MPLSRSLASKHKLVFDVLNKEAVQHSYSHHRTVLSNRGNVPFLKSHMMIMLRLIRLEPTRSIHASCSSRWAWVKGDQS